MKLVLAAFLVIGFAPLACDKLPMSPQVVETACYPTRDRAVDRATIGAIGRCFGKKWEVSVLEVRKCQTEAYSGYTATLEFRCK